MDPLAFSATEFHASEVKFSDVRRGIYSAFGSTSSLLLFEEWMQSVHHFWFQLRRVERYLIKAQIGYGVLATILTERFDDTTFVYRTRRLPHARDVTEA